MMELRQQIKLLRDDVIPRVAVRFKRPAKMAVGVREVVERVGAAARISAAEGYDERPLVEEGHMPLPAERAAVESLCAAARERLAATSDLPAMSNKAFFAPLLKREDLTPSSVFVQYALSNRILSTVARYLKMAPFLESVQLYYSRSGNTLEASQLWHKDRTDRSIVKVVVYCNDVDLETGPFSFLSSRDSKSVPSFLSHYLADDAIARYVPLAKTIQVTGAAGTTFMIDTARCYHFGSRCTKPRLAYFAYYTSGFGYYPRETDWSRLAGSELASGRLQRLALGLG